MWKIGADGHPTTGISANTWTTHEVSFGGTLTRRLIHGPFTRYAKLRVTHAPGMSGTFSPPLQVSDPDVHHDTCVTHVPWCMLGPLTSCFLWSYWRGRRSRHCRRMRNSQFCVSGKMPNQATPGTIELEPKIHNVNQRINGITISNLSLNVTSNEAVYRKITSLSNKYKILIYHSNIDWISHGILCMFPKASQRKTNWNNFVMIVLFNGVWPNDVINLSQPMLINAKPLP